jgi:hypothetical protein
MPIVVNIYQKFHEKWARGMDSTFIQGKNRGCIMQCEECELFLTCYGNG